MLETRRRRTAVLAVTAAAVVLAAMLLLVTRGDKPNQRVSSADAPTTTASSSSTTERPSTRFVGPAETLASSTSTSTVLEPSSADDTTTTADEPSNGDQPTHGLKVEVSPNPTAGKLIIVTLHVTNRRPDDSVGLRRAETGPAYWQGPPSANSEFGYCPKDRNVPRTNESIEFKATYRLPGRHTLVAQVINGYATEPEPNVFVPVEIDVAGPAGLSNGPFAPDFFYGPLQYPPEPGMDPTAAYLHIEVEEQDGVLDHLLIDWGDGTPAELIPIVLDPSYNGWACDAAQEYMGSGDMKHLPHHYVENGSYTVTVTAYSVGCDGDDPHQQGSASATLEAA